jgi:Exonuclease III
MRIDLMLLTERLAKQLTWGLIDRNMRKGPKDRPPSDHAPMFLDLDL